MVNSRSTQPIGSVFVGRQRELAELTAALDDALSGEGRLFMLVGEPGIGKTRTTQELASYAEQQGAQVFWGRCYEEEGTPPYWPWVLWTQSATCCGMPIEPSKSPSTPTVTRVSKASRMVRRSSCTSASSARLRW
ncbi:MAG: ATP-binding protein [Chloroflexota bacterium]|nr:ATP-binding protein [Chloroflexota bacterium]